MCGRSPRVSEALPLETIACPLCGETRFQPLFAQGDLALGVPGSFHLARCPGCGLTYQNPRVRADRLDACYPASYPPHASDPDLSGFPSRLSPAVRWVLARRLGYRHLPPVSLGWRDRLQVAFRGRRFVSAFPPFLGGGRLFGRYRSGLELPCHLIQFTPSAVSGSA